jgi:transcription elongation factor S-II
MTQYRDRVKEHLTNIFDDYFKDKVKNTEKLDKDDFDIPSLINEIEKGIYNFSLDLATKYSITKKWDNPEFCEIYKDISYKILVNLDQDCYIENNTLIPKLLNSELKSSKIAGMTSQELFEDRWRELFSEKLKKENLKYENANKATCDYYTCKKCKSKKANYYLLQLRSSDEPMSTLLNCLVCGHEWIVN